MIILKRMVKSRSVDKFKRKKTETVYNICKINEKTVTSFDKEQAKESYSV